MGRIGDANKGFHWLEKIPEGLFEVFCVGAGQTLFNRSDFHMLGQVSDEELISLYSRLALLVVPSRYEAFSYVSLEALFCGMPVVMSDRVRIADSLEGIAGYSVYNYGDNSDFLTKISETIGTRVDVETVRMRFSKGRSIEQYKKVYLGCFSAN